MINTYDFFGRNGQVLSIVDGTLSWIDPPKCCCDDEPARPRKKSYNCPNCGAPITGPRCEYCGTQFEKPKTIHYEISYPWPRDDIETQMMNLQAQLNEANAQMANSIQTQYLLNTLSQWTIEPYITRPTPLGTVRTR